MGSVYIGIGHNNNLMVSELGYIKSSVYLDQGRYHGSDFIIG